MKEPNKLRADWNSWNIGKYEIPEFFKGLVEKQEFVGLIKNCPWCNCPVVIEENFYHNDGYDVPYNYSVECYYPDCSVSCSIMAPMNNLKKAIEIWNKRAEINKV